MLFAKQGQTTDTRFHYFHHHLKAVPMFEKRHSVFHLNTAGAFTGCFMVTGSRGGARRPRPHPLLFNAYLEETSNMTPSSKSLLRICEGIYVPTLRLAMLTFVFLRSGQNITND